MNKENKEINRYIKYIYTLFDLTIHTIKQYTVPFAIVS